VLKTLEGHGYYVDSVAVLPDGKFALSAAADGIKLWSLDQDTATHCLRGHSDGVSSVVMLPDGKRALSASYDKTLKLWDIEKGVVLKTLKRHSDGVSSMASLPGGEGYALIDGVSSVAMLPDGKCALSSEVGGTLILWDIEKGLVLKTLEGHSRGVWSMAVLPDGKRALSASEDRTIKLWDIEKGLVLKTLEDNSRVTSMAVLPDGKRALFALHDKATLALWDVEKGLLLKALGLGEYYNVKSLTVPLDGDHVLSVSFEILMLWDLSTDQIIATLHGDSVFTCCSVAPDGKTIVAGDSAGRVHFLRIESASR
jgi:WD40 repeat protein